MRVHFLQHAPFEGIGAVAEWVARRGHELSDTHPYREDFVHPGDFEMLVVGGGPMNVDQELEHPWLAEEKALISASIDAGLPVIGICLGAQLVASVLGAQVTPGPQAEIGWYPVELTAEGLSSPVFSGLPLRFDALHWHGDTFAIPQGATRTASSAACENQAFEYDGGRVVGVQFHIEATPESWAALCAAEAGALEAGGEWVSSADEMLGKKALFGVANDLLFELLDRMAAVQATV